MSNALQVTDCGADGAAGTSACNRSAAGFTARARPRGFPHAGPIRRLAGYALALLIGLAVAPARDARAQEAPAAPGTEPPATHEEKIEDWTLRCATLKDGKVSCEMVQAVRQPDSGKELMLMAVGYPPGEKQLLAWIVLPLGVLLPPGLGLKVDDGEPARLAIQYCETAGCLAPWAPTDAELAALKAGTKLTVIVHDRSGKQFGLPVSLKGFTAALARIQ